MNGYERCAAVLRDERPDRTPFFPLLMFFAADRSGMAYREYASDGHSLASAQINMAENYHVDAVTVSSDAFRLCADLGGGMVFPENQTPYMPSPLVKDESDLRSLKIPDPRRKGSRMKDRLDAVSELRRSMGNRTMIFGWVEMPFAEACNVCGLANFMMMLIDAPELAHSVLEFITGIEIDFARAQIEAGAHAIGCGDAAASMISAPLFREFALPYEHRVNEAAHAAGSFTKLHMCGNSTHLLGDLSANGSDIYNVDHMVDLALAGNIYSSAGGTVKGNVNPVTDLMSATPEHARDAARRCVESTRGKKFMLGAGCEIPAATSDEVFFAFADAVNE
ncbi:MAG: uroporphyrinogen decarboxylase family protein [Synergistaceae bacterium]|nr:uroporphyrinogen decarboxylase family protein [Synergistaceae bacterium]